MTQDIFPITNASACIPPKKKSAAISCNTQQHIINLGKAFLFLEAQLLMLFCTAKSTFFCYAFYKRVIGIGKNSPEKELPSPPSTDLVNLSLTFSLPCFQEKTSRADEKKAIETVRKDREPCNEAFSGHPGLLGSLLWLKQQLDLKLCLEARTYLE